MSKIIKLQIPGGQANPAPPVGPALGQHGVNIQEFCTKFNAETQDRMGKVLPVEIFVNEDRSFTFKVKTPPAAELIKEVLNIKKGSANPSLDKIGSISQEQIRKIAEMKMIDLNTEDIESAMRTIAGTAKQMGIKIEE